MAVSQPPRGSYTYADLEAIPEDIVIRSIIDGELFVSPSPEIRHQDAVVNLALRLKLYANERGGKVLTGPAGLYYTTPPIWSPTWSSFARTISTG